MVSNTSPLRRTETGQCKQKAHLRATLHCQTDLKSQGFVNQPGGEGWVVDKVEQLLWISNGHQALHSQVEA